MARKKRTQGSSPYALVQRFPDGWYYRLGSGPSYPWLGPFQTEHVARQVREGATGGAWGYPRRHAHATIGDAPAAPGVGEFWDLYEEELTKSVAKDPSDYWLQPGEPPEVYARRVRDKFQQTAETSGLGKINLDSNTFKRLTRRLGIAKFSQRALKEAYAARGGRP